MEMPHGRSRIGKYREGTELQTLSQMSFQYDEDQYRSMNVGAHRRPAPLMGPPCLIWHTAFWKPPQIDENTWHSHVDYFLFLTFRNLQAAALRTNCSFRSPNYEGGRLYLFRNFFEIELNSQTWMNVRQVFYPIPSNERFVRYDFFSVSTVFYGLPITVRATLHLEYWTLGIFFDFSRLQRGLIPPTAREILNVASVFEEVGNVLTGRFTAHWDKSTPDETLDHEYLSRIRKAFITEFRDFVDVRLLHLCKATFSSIEETGLSFSNIGVVFAEFFGNVFGVLLKPPANSDTALPQLTYLNPGDNLHKRTIHAQIGEERYSPRQAHRLIDAVWPHVRALHRDEDLERAYGKPEYTISMFQNSRTIYISSLGRLTPGTRQRGNDPVIYTLIVNYPSRWQLGRIVERINNLGTLRLAAVRDIGRLMDANRDIRHIQNDLNNERKSGIDIDADSYIRRLIDVGGDIPNGMMFRINRSRYYVSSYVEELKQLHAEKVQGFQLYEEFVRRRLFDTYHTIDRMGSIYAELRAELELILQGQRTRHLVSLQQDMSSISRSIEQHAVASVSLQEKITTLSSSINRRHNETNTLLKHAEWLALPPLSYYGGYILHDLTTIPIIVSTFGELNLGISICISAILSWGLLLLVRKKFPHGQ